MKLETDLRTLAYIERWSIVQNRRRQSVAEHSYFVVLYAMRIAQMLNAKAPQSVNLENIMVGATVHDLKELVTGDGPSPISKMFKKLQNLPNIDCTDVKDRINEQFHEMIPWMATVGRNLKQDLTATEQAVIDVADYMEAILFLHNEQAHGSTKLEGHISYIQTLLTNVIESGAFSAKQQAIVEDIVSQSIDDERNSDLYVVTT